MGSLRDLLTGDRTEEQQAALDALVGSDEWDDATTQAEQFALLRDVAEES